MNDQTICFPIDSLDHLTINAKLPNFASDFTVSGSEHAEQVMKIDKEAMQFAGGKGTEAERQAWKDKLARQIAADPASIVAYYTINKYIDGKPLFDPMNDSDLRFIGAVANAFNSFRPDDPRSRNRVVVLNFTAYAAEFSPQLNKLLNDIYQKYNGHGLAIYQVSLDQDNVVWREAAKNLPWITVLDPLNINSTNVGTYNLSGIPTSFIIRGGEIVERVEDATQLKAAVAKYM